VGGDNGNTAQRFGIARVQGEGVGVGNDRAAGRDQRGQGGGCGADCQMRRESSA
jgi:hypothetical protein